MEDRYYEYLCSLVNLPKKKYTRLLRKMWQVPFKWFIPNDDNRAIDSINLREEFYSDIIDDINMVEEIFKVEVNMLELVISLAYRCESLTMTEEKPMRDWFWILISNVALYEYTDSNYDKLGGDTEVERILRAIIDRTYSRNGRGGFFPLTPSSKNKRVDQRKVEIWYQMSTYLVDNFYLENVTV